MDGAPLPACTDPGPLPAEFERIDGELRHVATSRPHENPFTCGDGYKGTTTIRSGETDHWPAGVVCSGDRTGMCCPYAEGTPVKAIFRRGAAALLPTFDGNPYWLCLDTDRAQPANAPPTAFQSPVVIDGSALALADYGAFHERPGSPVVSWWFRDRLALWNPVTNKITILGSLGGPTATCADVAPNGQHAVTVDAAGTASLWDAETGRALSTVTNVAPPSPPGSIQPERSCTVLRLRDIQWSADGRRALLTTSDGRVLLWDVARSEEKALALFAPATVVPTAFSPDGSHVVVDAENRLATVFDVQTSRAVFSREVREHAWLPRGADLAFAVDAADDARSWYVWNAKNGTTRALPAGCSANFGVGYFSLTDCRGVPTTVQIFADASQHPAATIELGAEARWSPTEGTLVLRTSEGVEAWSRARGRRRLGIEGDEIKGRTWEGRAFAFSPTGRRVSSPGKIFDLVTGTSASLAGTPETPVSGAFSPDGVLLLKWQTTSGSAFAPTTTLVARVFDAASGKLVFRGDDRTDQQPSRYTDVGVVAPRWLAGTDVLALPSAVNAAVVRLVRPRLGRALWMTLVPVESGIAAFVWDERGYYDGPDRLVRLEQPGASDLALTQRHPELLKEFLTARPVGNPADVNR